ncbi:MAG: hypothetical protein HEQ35_08305 [Gloeotrichia echinulata IR180]|nr:hypothetical protein [Gloeotrichia echinulata DEX184]
MRLFSHTPIRLSYRKIQLIEPQILVGARHCRAPTAVPLSPVEPDDLLRQELEEGLPLVLARGSEKARSEWIISPVLTAVRRLIAWIIAIASQLLT